MALDLFFYCLAAFIVFATLNMVHIKHKLAISAQQVKCLVMAKSEKITVQSMHKIARLMLISFFMTVYI